MKVAIITEGGQGIGFGHIARCISLYDAFKARGILPEFIINTDKSARNLLRGKKYREFNWLKERKRLLRVINSAEIAIIDSYKASYEFYDKVKKSVKTAVYIDDNKRLDYPSGIIINGSIGAELFHYAKKNGRICLLGTKYIPLRREFWNIPDKKTGCETKSVFLTFGGADSRNLTLKMLKLLVKEYPQWKKKVIIGMGFKRMKEIEEAKDKNTEVVYQPEASLIKKNMIAADIAISAGGQTLYELARIGVATIAIAVADNQANNIAGWKRKGFIEFAGHWNDKDISKKVSKAIEKLRNQKLRNKMCLAGKKLVDGLGSRRVVDFLLAK